MSDLKLNLYDAYLFDLDGTLVDTAPDLMVALNRTLQTKGFRPAGIELTRHWVGHGARVMIDEAVRDMGGTPLDETELDYLYGVFIGHYRTSIATESKPYPDVVETLEYLYKRVGRLGVVTNKRTDLSMQLLRALDLYRFFNIVVGGDTMQVQKPAAEPALYACNELNSKPEDTLFVGDSQTDIQCARAAGCKVVCMKDGYNHGIDPQTLGADCVIRTFAELVDGS